ncbi:CAP domain-containing protein [Haloplanus sp. C73]|uniref:CAP domain-containing protein n=1 Tax=Haloplanus sp. C73 TaxID=3421641 RepID=UPI003EB8D27B
MRWRQAILAAALALAAAAMLYADGASLTVAVATALLVYVGIRALIATYYRTKYWYHRDDTRHSRQCQRCGRRVSRRAGDTVIRCYHRINQHPHVAKPEQQCDWVEGWPVTRLFTRSVFARQFRRSITWKRLGVIVLACVLLFTPISISAGGALSSAGGAAATTNATATPTATATPDQNTAGENLNRSEIEHYLRRYINEERTNRGLRKLDRDSDLIEIARYHSRDMARLGYFAHESPGGGTMEDRYEKFGYQCRVSTGGDRYLSGAENIAYTVAFSRVDSPTEGTVLLTTEKEIARHLANNWMNSPPHKENILREPWENVGHGIYITQINGEVRVYATQNFC